MKKLVSLILSLCMMLFACTAFASTDIGGGTIQVEGMSAPNQMPPMGYRAAQVDAYRQLLESVKGVQVDADSTMENFMLTNDVVKTKVNGLVQGAVIVNKFKDADGYHVVMEVPVFGVGSVAAAVIPSNPAPAPLPAPEVIVPQAPVTAAVGAYTGVIVDCTGLGIQTAMAPGIFTPDLQVVYGLEHFSDSVVINRGYVGYSKSLNSGVQRAGANPLVIKAQSVHKFVNPVISPADAGRILAENKVSGFLAQGNVVFVR